MIDEGFITKGQYKTYINQMHPMMFSCFDIFLPTIILNNVIEQIMLKENDMVVMCCDGMSDWIKADEIFEQLSKDGINLGIDKLILKSKDLALQNQNYYDDITAIALKVS